MEQKTIAVLTSGGDAPGMNAAVRAVVRTAIANDMRVLGVRRGYDGLIHGDMIPMNLRSVSDIIQNGGTALFTARSPAFMTEEGQKQAVDTCKKFDISGVVVIGGDGSFRGAKALCEKGIPCVAIPGTIDNDIACTEYTIGFDTAMNTAVEMVDRLRDTTESHNRCSVVEVMGRRCGDIALWAGVAGAADIILVPERPLSWADAANRLAANKLRGQLTSIVMIAEGAGKAEDFCEYVRKYTDVEIKATVLGYIQRGGNPSAFDRVLAAKMGQRAVELLADEANMRGTDRAGSRAAENNDLRENFGYAVGIRENRIISVPLAEAVSTRDCFDDKLYDLNSVMAKF